MLCFQTTSPLPILRLTHNEFQLKYALSALSLVCLLAIFFAGLSLFRLDGLERKAAHPAVKADRFRLLVWRLDLCATLATLLCSLAGMFVSALQLFFALKLAKCEADGPRAALRFLHDGQLLRLPTLCLLFSSALGSLAALLLGLVFLPSAVEAVPRALALFLGLCLLAFCALACLHACLAFRRCDGDLSLSSASSRPPCSSTNPRYSTLV